MRRLSRIFPRDSLYPLLAALLALAVFLPGIDWGLPSRADDAFLFGERRPWSGEEILKLAGGLDADSGRGADVDANPIDRSADPVVLNDTDAKRAEIVRRYRLFSHQPDEFINFKAIAGMAQRRDADPRLYQYGGLWIYPVAALLGAAKVVGFVELHGELAWYLDRPQEFGKFYVVARLYSAMWGAIGAAVVFVIVRRLTASSFTGFCASLAFALLPVVVTAAHEAKPHLAGAVLVLWAVVKADDFVSRGRRRDALWAGALCGAASAMVVSMVVSFAVLPVMGLLRWRRERIAASGAGALNIEHPTSNIEHRSAGGEGVASTPVGRRSAWRSALLALAVGIGLYVLTNPYLVYHVLFDRAVFESNISNSTAMYQARDLIGGLTGGMVLLAIAAGTLFFFAAVFAALVMGARRARLGARAWLLVTAGAAVLFYFLPLGAGKPPEYARFGIVPMTVLLIAFFAIAGRGLFPLPGQRRWLSVAGVVLVAVSGIPYVVNFVADSGPGDTRMRAAKRLAEPRPSDGALLRLEAEPAPWSAPPFDLWGWRAMLDTGEERPQVEVRIVDDAGEAPDLIAGPFITPISWANKPFQILDQAPTNGVRR